MTKHLLAAAVALFATAAQAATRYEIDTAHSHATFSIRHMMVSNVRGEFGNVTGEVNIDEKDLAKSSVKATIDVKTLNTGNQDRDNHLKAPDFFDVAKFPTMTFESTKVTAGDKKGTYKVDGNLTMHGVTKPVTLMVEELSEPVTAPKQMGGMVKRGASATTTINRKDFGLTYNAVLEKGGVALGEDVKVTLDVELNEKAAAPAGGVKPASGTAPKK